MYVYQEPYSIKEIINVSALIDTAQNKAIKARKFMISNTGAQPLYFKEKDVDNTDVTALTGFLIPANTVFPVILTASNLSLISNATGTTAAIMILDI